MRRRPATYEDLLQVPPEKVAEILDGDLIVSPRPASPHARVASGLAADLLPFDHQQRRGPGDPGGWWILPEPELHLGPDVLVPDLAGWRCARLPTVPNVAFFDVRPDWACEIVSPSTEHIDRKRKMRIYAREGVPHVWLVNPTAQVLEVYRLERGERYLVIPYSQSEDEKKVRAEPFEQVEIDLSRWWILPPPPGSR
jgi:Uma2 family endonuclease